MSSPECDLCFAPFEPEVSRVTTLPKSQNKHDPQPRDTKFSAHNRSKTASQEQPEESSERRKEPENTRAQQHQKKRQGANNVGARQNAQRRQLDELRVFKRVHILPVQIDRTVVRGRVAEDRTVVRDWVTEVLGQNQQKTSLERPMLPGGGYVTYPACAPQ